MSLNNLNKRLEYYGGSTVKDRVVKGKERTLKNSLINSYQSETVVFENGKKFRCLINPIKETEDFDTQMISILYKDICLNDSPKGKTSKHIEDVPISNGTVFLWEDTNTHWLVYLQDINEHAYFRANIRKCEQEVEIGDRKYWTYIRGPVETNLVWNQKGGVEWNDLNYSLIMYVTRDDNTISHLHRFDRIRVKEPGTDILKTWEVVAVNPYEADGIISVNLSEYFENPIADAAAEERKQKEIDASFDLEISPYLYTIDGPDEVKRYSTVTYTIDAVNGVWEIIENNVTTNMGTQEELVLDINTKLSSFIVQYKKNNEILCKKTIKVKPF